MNCSRCEGGTLTQQSPGFYCCDSCGCAVSADNYEDPY